MLKLNFKIVIEILIIIIISMVFLFWFSAYIPLDMDEFASYHALSRYYYPLNILNVFRECSIQYDLAPVAKYYLPLRSYYYIGSIPCIFYYPLFKIWPSPYSARLLGLIMLSIQAFFIYKIFKIDLLASFIFLLFFMQYAFQHLITSDSSFQLTSVFFICYLAQQWKIFLENNSKYSWIYPLNIGIVIFLGIWIKLTYFFIIPCIFLLILYYIHIPTQKSMVITGQIKRKTLIKEALILYAATAIPTFILLNSMTRNGYKYYQVLIGSPITNILNYKSLACNFFYKLAKYLFNPLSTAHRILIVPEGIFSFAGLLLTLIVACFLVFGIRQLYLKKIQMSFVLLNIFLFFMAIFIMNMSQMTWAMHHIVLSFPFLIFALCYIYSKLRKNIVFSILLGVFILANFSLYFKLTKLHYMEKNHPSKLKINELLNKEYASKYIFIIIDGGMYSIKALYGKKEQCVFYIHPFHNIVQVRILKNLLNQTKRKPLFVGRIDSESDLSLIKRSFPDIMRLQTDFDTGKWRIWYSP